VEQAVLELPHLSQALALPMLVVAVVDWKAQERKVLVALVGVVLEIMVLAQTAQVVRLTLVGVVVVLAKEQARRQLMAATAAPVS